MSYILRFKNLVGPEWVYWFPAAICAGACFEIFKTKFTFMGVNYYKVFKRKQLESQLNDLEDWLKQLDALSEQAVQNKLSGKAPQKRLPLLI